MTYTKKFLNYLFLYFIFIKQTIFCYPALGEFYKSPEGHTILILVNNNIPTNEQTELKFKREMIEYFKILLSDNEISLILDAQLEQISSSLKELIDRWNKEFDNDPTWISIVEQNYSTSASTVAYKKKMLTPLEATKFYVLLSKMKNYINNLPIKEHLGFIQKIGIRKENNLFKSCQYARDYFKLGTQLNSAIVNLGDWQTPTIARITDYYNKGLKKLSNSDNQFSLNSIEDIAIAFVPHDENASEFTPLNNLKIKDLLDDLTFMLKKLDILENSSNHDYEKMVWRNLKARMQAVKDFVLNAIVLFKNLSEQDKKIFEQLFKSIPKYQYAQLHWFAIIYAYVVKNETLNNYFSSENNNEWIKILSEDLLIIGLMEAISVSKNNQTKTVIYLNPDTYHPISQHLTDLGYDKILAFNNLKTNKALNAQELEALIKQFPVNIRRVKQVLQQPLTCSFLI